MNKIRKGDEIIVTAGKDKGRRGTVLEVFADDRVLVDGVNLAKKHVKPNPNATENGGIVDTEAAMDVSNVAIYNPTTDKADRAREKALRAVQAAFNATAAFPAG